MKAYNIPRIFNIIYDSYNSLRDTLTYFIDSNEGGRKRKKKQEKRKAKKRNEENNHELVEVKNIQSSHGPIVKREGNVFTYISFPALH